MSATTEATFHPRFGQGKHAPRAPAEVLARKHGTIELAESQSFRWALDTERRYGQHVPVWSNRAGRVIQCTGPCIIEGTIYLGDDASLACWSPILTCSAAGIFPLPCGAAYLRPAIRGDQACTVWLLITPA